MATKTELNLLPYREGSLYEQMALDEFLLGKTDSQTSFMRLCKFVPNCASIGYFQSYENVPSSYECWTRRKTGGGLVLHNDDIIFSMTGLFPEIRDKIFWVYENIHNAIKVSLGQLDIALESATKKKDCSRSRFQKCFSTPVQYDLIKNETKVVGGAICRKSNFFLYQGSIQQKKLNHPIDIEFFQSELSKSLVSLFNYERSVNSDIDERHLLYTKEACDKKYQSLTWKQKY